MCALVLVAGFALKAQCLSPWDGRQYSRLCYNDIQALHSAREIDRGTFPYIHGELENGGLSKGAIEYPVLTGVFMWVTGRLADDANTYFVRSVVLLAPFALVVAWLLGRVAGTRALMWATAPALVLYAFHNWDLLVVGAAVAGIYLASKKRTEWAAVAFGIGAGFKLYPAFLVVPLALERVFAGDRRAAVRCVLVAAAAVVVVNLPFALVNFEGWWATYRFHELRLPNWDSVWTWRFPDFLEPQRAALSSGGINLVSGLLFGGSFLGAVAYGWRRGRTEGEFPALAVSGAVVAAFLAFNKVHSPQYTLWILPFFALLGSGRGPWVAWALYSVVDLAVYVGVFRWFYDFVYRDTDLTIAKQTMVVAVWGRAALLAVLFFLFLVSRPSYREREFDTPSP